MSEQQPLVDFLQSRRATRENGQVDRTDVLAEWIKDLGALMDEIEVLLKDVVESGYVNVKRINVYISEPDLSPYDAPSLVLDFDGTELQILPRFRMTVGARGRVDFVCGALTAILLRIENGKWAFAGQDRRSDTVPLTRESFDQVLQDLLA
ncbi:MAG: hypothetical protein R6V85_06335 [Polyangia bacterium]